MSSSYIYIIPNEGEIQNLTDYGDICNGGRSSYMFIRGYFSEKYPFILQKGWNDLPNDQQDVIISGFFHNPTIDIVDRNMFKFFYEFWIRKENIDNLITTIRKFMDRVSDVGNLPQYIEYLKKIKTMENVFGVCYAHHDDNDEFYQTEDRKYVERKDFEEGNRFNELTF
jgi:hypothetical protein